MPAADSLRIHILDMGQTKYGDCLLIQGGGKTILVDGGHPGDWKGQGDFKSIPDQLAGLLDQPPPFKVSLLVVTHCHSDHIGCLPKLVADGTLQAEWALVADEYLGFGRSRREDDFAAWQGLPAETRQVAAGLREENHADLPDAELVQFLADAASLEANYRDLLARLTQAGTKVVRFLGEDTKDLPKLTRAFAAVGLKVFGPSEKQLLTCTEVLAEANADNLKLMSDCLADAPDPVGLYRSLASRPGDAADRPGKGAALNDQSIVFRVAVGEAKALLTGDMQFAKPEIDGVAEEVEKLMAAVAADGPFGFVKIAHHGSYNALDAKVLSELSKDTRQYAISGGIDDPGHPDVGVLQLLKKKKVHWARTDRNGLISVTVGEGGAEVTLSRGKKDDPTPNAGDVSAPTRKPETSAPQPPPSEIPAAPAPQSPPAAKPIEGSVVPAAPATPARPVKASLPARGREPAEESVEVFARVPHARTSVRLTIEVTPGGPDGMSARIAGGGGGAVIRPADLEGVPGAALGGGRTLPPLLFVTSRAGLTRNLGEKETEEVLSLITDAGQALFDGLPAGLETAQASLPVVRRELSARPDVQGLVLLGGYDVIPPLVQDTIDAKLRAAVQGKVSDADNFIVWADGPYGDADGRGNRLVPVSRIPDGKSPDLVRAALTADRPVGHPLPLERFGIRNVARPFADLIFSPLPGSFKQLLVSMPTLSGQVRPTVVMPSSHHYFMLHGSDRDGTRFWGEDDGDYPVAFEIRNVPEKVAGTIFTGCCWGALAAEPKASRFAPGQLAPRTPDDSVALRFLRAGALAFIGCTGSHYSPTAEPYDYYGGPMHLAFWRQYVEKGLPPARALLEAKREFLAGIPHRPGPVAKAIEMKIFRQYTCLGLGW